MIGCRLGGGRLLKSGGRWLGVWTDARGRRHRRTLSTDRRIAERALAAEIRTRDLEANGLLVEEGMERRLSEIQERYLQELASYAKPAHQRRIAHVTAKVIAALGDIAVRDLRLDGVLVYRQRRVKQGKAARTCNLEVGGFRSMLAWATKVGIIPRNPIANLQPLPAGKAHETMPRRAFTGEEIERFLEASLTMDRDGERHLDARPGQRQRFHGATHRPRVPQTALWRTFLYTGARWGELVATTWADIDEHARTLTFRAKTTKGKRQRIIPLVDVVVADLASLREVHRRLRGREPEPGEPIFLAPAGKSIMGNETRARWRFRQVLKRAGIERVDAHGRRATIHGLRHSFCSMLARAGVGLVQAQQLMGHSDPRLTSAIYTHLGVEDLRGAVERLQSAGRAAARGAATDRILPA